MKAILVIDVPTESLENVIASVNICEQREGYNIILKRMGKMCLKPMPKKKIVLEHRVDGYTVNGIEMAQAHGYNECLKDILGEPF